MPIVHKIYPEYFQELEDWTQELLNGKDEEASCDSNNNLKLADNEFGEYVSLFPTIQAFTNASS